MPPRIARSSIAAAAPKTAKNKSRKRNLDAYSIAAHSIKPSHVPKHRLGEVEDSGPTTKRRRDDDDDDGDDSEEDVPKKKVKGSGMMGEDDGVEEGEDSEGNEWTMGGLREGDEESDLDSEEAFGSSDEERFEGFTFRGSSTVRKGKKAVRKREVREDGGKEVDLNEDEDESVGGGEDEEGSDDFGDEGVDLATMLDGDDASDPGDEDDNDDSGSGSSNGDDPNADSSESESDASDDAEGEEVRIARLHDRIDTLASRDRPATSNPTNEPADENGLLPMDDLYADIMADLNPEEKKQHLLASMKKKSKSNLPKALTAPLPKRQQDRMDRGVASAKAKEQLDRWLPTVKHNREAEFLTFPLVDPSTTHRVGKDKFVMTIDQPQNDLEKELQKIREESGMAAPKSAGGNGKADDEEDQLIKAEELAVRAMPVEEVMRRRAELRMRRDLLFREERKAKRVAKIKSKSFRRVHRRERAAEEAKEAEMNEGLPEDEDEREKSDRKRAEQRMSTKHKDSKFAKSMKATNRTVWDEGARDGVNEAARRQEELKRRIAGEDVGDKDEGSDVSDVSSDEGGSDDEERAMLRRLNRLREEGRGIGSQKGVGGMKFMREAEERLRKRNDEDVERLRKEMAVADGEEAEDDSGDEGGGLGRAIFGPRAKEGAERVKVNAKRPELEEGSEDEDESAWKGFEEEDGVVERGGVDKAKEVAKSILKKPGSNSSGLLSATRDRRDPEASKAARGDDGEAVSSWVTGGDEEEEEVESAEQTADAADEPGPIAAAADAQNSKRKAKVSLGTVLGSEVNDEQPTTVSVSAGATEGWQTIPATNDSENESADSDSDADDSKPVLTAAEQKSAMHRRAFAGDDVVQAFEAEKAADAAEEDIQESSNYMPGWGSWAGTGLSKSIRKANSKAAHNPLFKTKLPGGGVSAEGRRDKGKDKVIVSEKTERKGKKYLAPVLPHGFGRKEEYEGALRVPVGPEWTTKEVFQRGTRPRVVVRPGSITTAMERPMM
ncbi:hypothetical protein LTR97_001223 [Elasticomyces elasticus]|uniref:U3 small nucleolar RNA-associated protein 14 n=1 Tax=Elasticomyces elasticus TaxID=574655 RepID=A0AAN7WII8_9PEZI|nr:hypothetical protein LTR97_001223 [Elasticomyces elasticus]